MQQQPTRPTWSRVLLTGAAAGFGLAMVYSQLFSCYAIVRSSIEIITISPGDISLGGSLLANAMSIALASTSSALLLGLFTALLGMMTAAAIKLLLRWFNRPHEGGRAILIGVAASLAIILAFQFSLRQLMGQPLANLGAETYLFWLGLPALVHIGAGAFGSWRLNHQIHPHTHMQTEKHHDKPNLHARTI